MGNPDCRIRIVMISISLLLTTICMRGFYSRRLDREFTFSKESGFYEQNFYLELTGNPHYTIRYTTDGSTPTEDSQLYTEPILIADVSGRENKYSTRSDTSICFYVDEIDKYGWTDENVKYVVPQFSVDKCNIIRAVQFNEKGEPVAEKLGVYFVDFENKEGYDNILIASIVTDPENLFDYERGIYVTGRKWDEFKNRESKVWVRWDANYFEKGREWEREALVDIFDEQRHHCFSSPAGIRIQGGASRTYAQKSLSIYAREEYGGSNTFKEDLFQNGIGYHKFLLSAGGQDYKVKVKDYLIQSIAKNSGENYSTVTMLPCALFLNGEYWGVYYLAESYNSDYVAVHYGVNKNNVIVVKDAELEDGVESDMDLYDEMIEFIVNNDMQKAENYEKACELIDIKSFVDYYATEIYLGNTDWPYANVAMWRARETSSSNLYCDGRWRWMLYDLNIFGVMNNIYETDDFIQRTQQYDELFASLIKNEDVQRMLYHKIGELAEKVYTEENVKKVLDEWSYVMKEPINKNGKRYFGEDNVDIQQLMEIINTFFAGRASYMQKCMRDNLYETE